MLQFALNHMTVPHCTPAELAALAQQIGCTGVELRNDLSDRLFDGQDPGSVGETFRQAGLAVHALAEIYGFNNPQALDDAKPEAFLDAAASCGAEAVVLIPQMGGSVPVNGLRAGLERLAPELNKRGLIGLVEALGFAESTLRQKSDAVAAIEKLGLTGQIKLVHDTFHHFLAGGPLYAEHTGIVHISGVTDASLKPSEFRDAHRGLVDAQDRLGNTDQIQALRTAGYAGPISFEAFAPETHAITDPKEALLRSKNFIETACQAVAA